MYDICCSFLKMLEYSGSSSDQDLLIMTTHFFCDRCGQGFETRRQLNNHLPIHRNEVFACRECEKAFVSKTKLKNHVRDKHSKERYIVKMVEKESHGRNFLECINHFNSLNI